MSLADSLNVKPTLIPLLKARFPRISFTEVDEFKANVYKGVRW